MAKNDFKPFAIGENSNVLSQVDYEALPALTEGFTKGTAFSEQLNKVWRQSSIIGAIIGEFITTQSGDDALDDGDLSKLEASFLRALLKYINNNVLKQKNATDSTSGALMINGGWGLGSIVIPIPDNSDIYTYFLGNAANLLI